MKEDNESIEQHEERNEEEDNNEIKIVNFDEIVMKLCKKKNLKKEKVINHEKPKKFEKVEVNTDKFTSKSSKYGLYAGYESSNLFICSWKDNAKFFNKFLY